ncbi:M16 family metallopeptidase [Algoriphagus namhaensis]
MKLDRSKAPAFKIPQDFEVAEPHQVALANGATLFFVRTPNIDAVKLDVVGESARQSLSLENQMVPRLCLQMLTDGTRSLSSEEISEELDFYASEISPLTSFSHEGLRLLSTKKQFWNVLPLFKSLFEEAIFPEDLLEKKKNQKKISLKIDREKTSSRANQLFREALFGSSHPFGFEPSEEQVDALHRGKLVDYYQSSLWTNLEFFLAADLDPTDLHKLIKELENLPNQPTMGSIMLPIQKGVKVLHESKEGAVQSSLRFGGSSIPMSHPDYHRLSFFNTILGGYFGSRLIKNIREDKGHTYGIYSSLQVIDQYDYWMIGAEIQKDFKEEVMQEIFSEIKKLSLERVDEDEMETVRNYSIGTLISQFSNSFDLIDRFKSVHRNGLGMEFYQDKMQNLKSIQAEEIQDIAQKYFGEDPEIQIIVG